MFHVCIIHCVSEVNNVYDHDIRNAPLRFSLPARMLAQIFNAVHGSDGSPTTGRVLERIFKLDALPDTIQ